MKDLWRDTLYSLKVVSLIIQWVIGTAFSWLLSNWSIQKDRKHLFYGLLSLWSVQTDREHPYSWIVVPLELSNGQRAPLFMDCCPIGAFKRTESTLIHGLLSLWSVQTDREHPYSWIVVPLELSNGQNTIIHEVLSDGGV